MDDPGEMEPKAEDNVSKPETKPKKYELREEDKHWIPYFDFLITIFLRFDPSFCFLIMLENFNFGLWVLV